MSLILYKQSGSKTDLTDLLHTITVRNYSLFESILSRVDGNFKHYLKFSFPPV